MTTKRKLMALPHAIPLFLPVSQTEVTNPSVRRLFGQSPLRLPERKHRAGVHDDLLILIQPIFTYLSIRSGSDGDWAVGR